MQDLTEDETEYEYMKKRRTRKGREKPFFLLPGAEKTKQQGPLKNNFARDLDNLSDPGYYNIKVPNDFDRPSVRRPG